MKALELEREVKTLEARRAELRLDLERATENLDAARAALLRGESKAEGSVIAAQSRASALTEAVGSLDRLIADRRGELTAAREQETRASTIEQLTQLAKKATEHLSKMFEACEQANQALAAPMGRAVDALERAATARKDFLELLRTLAPGVDVQQYDHATRREQPELVAEVVAVTNELETAGVNLVAVRPHYSGTSSSAIDRDYQAQQLAPFGVAVSIAFQVEMNGRKQGEGTIDGRN